MKVIGITGGMASGKSTVAQMFAGPGIRHLDADRLVHQLMREDSDTIAALEAAFPTAVTQGQVDRAALAGLAAQNSSVLVTLEHILHPRVRAKEEEQIEAARAAGDRAIILDIPLLFETDAQVLCDVVIVAYAPRFVRRLRAFRRPGMTQEKWRRLLDRQLPDHVRLRKANSVIPTFFGLSVTRFLVTCLRRRWGLL